MLVFVIVRAPSLSSSTRRRCFRSPDSGPADVNLLCSQLMVLQLAAEHPFAEHPDIDWLMENSSRTLLSVQTGSWAGLIDGRQKSIKTSLVPQASPFSAF